MALYNDWQDLNKNGTIGDWAFFVGSDNNQYIAFKYADPEIIKNRPPEYLETYRGEISHIPITTGEKQPKFWLWDGNREAPTISPSINIIGKWHGYIKNGKLEVA